MASVLASLPRERELFPGAALGAHRYDLHPRRRTVRIGSMTTTSTSRWPGESRLSPEAQELWRIAVRLEVGLSSLKEGNRCCDRTSIPGSLGKAPTTPLLSLHLPRYRALPKVEILVCFLKVVS